MLPGAGSYTAFEVAKAIRTALKTTSVTSHTKQKGYTK